MRKIISVIYLLCFFSLVNTLSAQITFTASSETPQCDNANFCVEISVTNFDSVTSFQHVYDWDTTIMQLTSFTDFMPVGIGTDPNGLPDSLVSGRAPYSWIDLSFPSTGATLADDFVIAELCFSTNNIGTGMVSFDGNNTTLQTVSAIENGVNTPNVAAAYDAGTVTIQDTEDPVINCPTNVVLTSNGTNVSGIAPTSFTDNCGVASVTFVMVNNGMNVGGGNDDASGQFFGPGTTTVTYTATDEAGNTGVCSFDVTLNTAPAGDDALQFIPEVNFDCDAGTVSIDMLVTNFDSITGVQFGMQWDTAVLNYISATNALPAAATYNNVNDSTIAFFWFPFSGNPLSLADSSIIFTLDFTLNGTLEIPLLNIVSFPGIPIGAGQIQNGTDVNLTHDVDFFCMPEILNIIDNTGPMIADCPIDIMVSNDPDSCNAVVNWTAPTITDNCGIDTIIVSHMPGETFSVGTQTVTYTVTDIGGNIETCSFDVTVTDSEDPVITCPGSVTVDATFGTCANSTVNIGAATATDNCGVASITNDAPTSFPVGETTVTWMATDVNGLTATCTQTITIEDNEDPTITCPMDIGECPGATITLGTPITDDNCGIDSVTNDAPVTFPIGMTIVTWTVTDDSGNTATCQQRVTIQDDVAPTITCPLTDAIDAENGMCSAVYSNNLTPTVSDNCDMDLTVTYSINNGGTITNGTDDATGETFAVGSNMLTYYVEDDNGNIDSCSVVVQVNDNQLPVLNCPNNMTIFVPAGIVDTMVNGISLNALDNCGVASTTFEYSGELTGMGIGSDASGTFFPPGTTTVTYFVEDVNGNIDSCNFDINVQTVSNDLIGCQPDQVESNDLDECSAVVNGIAPTLLVPVVDIASINYTLTGATIGTGTDDASGIAYNVGVTTLEYIATDNFGNMDSCSLTITINDTQIPDWTNCSPDITEDVNVGGSCSGQVFWTLPIASDNCGIEEIVASHVSGDTFPVGTTPVSYVAIDTAGNIATCSFLVTIEDNTPPTGSCPANISVDASPGDCDAVVTWDPITGTDACSAVTVTCTAMSGETFPVGTTTVICTFSDTNGNSSMCDFDVTVMDSSAPIPQDCPGDITLSPNLTDCQAIANWTPPTFLDCPPVNVTSTHEPGDTFDIGSTTVIYIAIDPAGNDTTCTFEVIVEDSEAPVVTCPTDINVNSLANDCGAFVNWPAPTVTDNCDNNVTITQVPSPGTFFPVGSTTVTVTATDAAGNSDMCTFEIIVNDVIAPEIVCADDVTINLDGTITGNNPYITSAAVNGDCSGMVVIYDTPTATDNCSVSNITMDGIASGESFPIGTTLLEFMAFDPANNFAPCSFNVTIEPLADIIVEISDSEVCEGEDITFSTTGNMAGAQFDWDGPNMFDSQDSNPFINNVSVDNAGTYLVTITYASGCTVTGSVDLTVTTAAPIEASSNSPLCMDGDIELMVVPGGDVIFEWTGPDNFMSNIQNPVIANASAANSGVYNVIATYPNGCTASSSTTVTFTNLPAPEIDMDCITDLCLGSSCVLTGTEYAPSPDMYNWTAVPSEGAGLPENTDNNQITITPTAPGTYIYTYSVEIGPCVSEEVSQVVIVHEAPEAVDDEYLIPFGTEFIALSVNNNDVFNGNIGETYGVVSSTVNGTIEYNEEEETFIYTPDPGFIGVDQFIYEICYDCGPILCDNALVTLTITDDRECVFPTVITPNGDDKNEVLFINCLADGNFINNEIIIYNQWGDEVFTAAPYQNNWDGTHDGEDLPDGTYYYVFRLDDNAELVKSYITIFR